MYIVHVHVHRRNGNNWLLLDATQLDKIGYWLNWTGQQSISKSVPLLPCTWRATRSLWLVHTPEVVDQLVTCVCCCGRCSAVKPGSPYTPRREIRWYTLIHNTLPGLPPTPALWISTSWKSPKHFQYFVNHHFSPPCPQTGTTHNILKLDNLISQSAFKDSLMDTLKDACNCFSN